MHGSEHYDTNYNYNGLGDRVSQTNNGVTTNYSLDLNTGLTQVLSDGTNTYLYGLGRIGEQQANGFVYHLGDALGSVRQLVDVSGVVQLTRSYEPYGAALASAGNGSSTFGFTGEQLDQSNLIFLRARFYDGGAGRFLSRDSWGGDSQVPMSYNGWVYVGNNPISFADPSGHCAGFAGIDAALAMPMAFTTILMVPKGTVDRVGHAYSNAWQTCAKSLQDAGKAIQEGNYGYAALHASGLTAVTIQMSKEMEEYNKDVDVVFSQESLDKRLPHAAHLGWGATVGAANIVAVGQAVSSVANCAIDDYVFKSIKPIGVSANRALVPYDPEFATSQMMSWSRIRIARAGLTFDPFTDSEWGRMGTSPRVGDFTEIKGLTPAEALQRVPYHWNIESQAEGAGIKFSNPSPSGIGPDEFRIKLPVARFEPGAYAADGSVKYYIGRVGINLGKGHPLADKWGVGSLDDSGNLLNPNNMDPFRNAQIVKNFREHMRLYIRK